LNRRTTTLESIIDLDAWDTLEDLGMVPPQRVPVIGYDADRDGASVFAAWWGPDQRVTVRTVATGPGPAWLVDVVPSLVDRLRPDHVMADDGGHARSVTEDLRRDGHLIDTVAGRDYGTMCSSLLRLARSGRITHDGSPELRSAWAGAALRFVGDQEAFDRRRARTPQHALLAVAAAVRGLTNGPQEMAPPDVRF
jgi:hypothetical protein